MRHILIIISLGMVISFIVVACSFTSRTPDASATLRAVYTSQAGTVQVLETRAGPLPTSIAGITPSAPNVLPATISTPAAPITQPALQTDGSCNKAEFVQDVSIPDGSKFSPGEVFTKTWRLKNIGTCSWNKGYALVFSTGNVMNGASSTALPVIVNPGDTVDISVGLTAPSSAGAYRGYWLLRSDSGSTFGLGSAASVPFFVDIVVVASVGTSLDFTADYCGAVWRSGSGDLSCPGNINNPKGYVILVENPKLENGEVYSGKALLMVPENSINGYIQGIYPEYTIQNGDHFRVIVNCDYQASGCNALLRVDYQISNGTIFTLWQFSEAYEGKYYSANVDLSPLAGNTVRFILSVFSEGSAENDKVIWAGPRIERP